MVLFAEEPFPAFKAPSCCWGSRPQRQRAHSCHSHGARCGPCIGRSPPPWNRRSHCQRSDGAEGEEVEVVSHAVRVKCYTQLLLLGALDRLEVQKGPACIVSPRYPPSVLPASRVAPCPVHAQTFPFTCKSIPYCLEP